MDNNSNIPYCNHCKKFMIAVNYGFQCLDCGRFISDMEGK